MGQVHARAWSRLLQHYPDAPFRPVIVAVADPAPRRGGRFAAAFGDPATYDDWRELVARDDLDVVSMARAQLPAPRRGRRRRRVRQAPVDREAGRAHVAGDRRDRGGRRAAGVQSAAGFNYRNAPAVEWARSWSTSGRLGRIQQVEVRFLADYAAHPDGGAVLALTSTSTPAAASRRPGQPRGRPGALRRRATSPSWSPTRASSSPSGRAVEGAGSHFARGGGELRPGRERGLRRGAAALRRAVPAARSSSSRTRGRRAVHLRHRRPRRPGRVRVGLPPDGRAPGLPRPGLPGRVVLAPSTSTAGTASPGRVPAGRRHRDGLRRPQGDRGRPAGPLHRRAASRSAPPSTTRCARPGSSTRCRTRSTSDGGSPHDAAGSASSAPGRWARRTRGCWHADVAGADVTAVYDADAAARRATSPASVGGVAVDSRRGADRLATSTPS